MVRANSPAILASIKSKPHQVRRSLSGTSIDVKGSVVMEKVWLFEGMQVGGMSTEKLSDDDTGKDDWCEKHSWFLYTNLMSVQQCSKCSKRILTKRAAYKCTECKRLCHLKCAIKEDESLQSNVNPKISPTNSANMDFRAFVRSDDMQTCRYAKKTSNNGRRERRSSCKVVDNNNDIEDMEIQEEPIREDYRPSHQELDLSKLSELHSTNSSQSQTKQRLNSMKHGFVKRCRSIKNKVKTFKDKVHTGDNHKSTDNQAIPSSTSTTSSSTKNTDDPISEQQKAWVRSPVRTRLRERQLEVRRDSLKAKTRVRKNNTAKLRMFENTKSNDSTEKCHSNNVEVHPDFDNIKGRIEVIEKRVSDLETSIPKEIHEWHNLKKKFMIKDDYRGTRKKNVFVNETDRFSSDETHPKHIEAMKNVPLTQSASSGTTSDEVYVVPDCPSYSSQDYGNGIDRDHQTDRLSSIEQYNSKRDNNITQSPVTSLNDDSLPSGIPNRLRLGIGETVQGTYSELQTSTPVTNREISFRSASKKYETTHDVQHKNITQISMDKSYMEPDHEGTAEIIHEQRTSIVMEPTVKVLSPEQIAVKGFLEKRKTASASRLTNNCRKSRENQHSPSEFMSQSTTFQRSPYNLRSRKSRYDSQFETSPKLKVHQASFYSSPPMASSTFHENGSNGVFDATMSPVQIDNDHKLDENEDVIYGTVDKNASSASNFSYTFRNDSQMIQTNAEEDLPGFTRNNFANRGCFELTGEVKDLETDDDHSKRYDRLTRQHDGIQRGETTHVTFATHDNMSTPITTTTDDALSLTNVTAFTGDLANSFADSGHGANKSRWINKDVYMFERDEFGNPIRPTIPRSHDVIDEKGDRGKPPIPKKHSTSSTDIDYLREAEKKLDMYKARRSGETFERGSYDNLHGSTNNISIDSFLDNIGVQVIPETVEQLHRSPVYQCPEHTESKHSSSNDKKIPYNLRHGDLKTKSRSPSPKKYQGRNSSPTCDTSPTNSCHGRNSPSKNQAMYCSSLHSNHSDSRNSQTSIKVPRRCSPKPRDTTTEFEELERRLKEESMNRGRRSQSLTNLQQHSLSGYGYTRQKSLSCTNSVDGETKSFINDNARYHFLHDKGMIKISSPSLKIMNDSPSCRRKYQPEYNHIDEESSDIVQSGSESNLSGIVVDNTFHVGDHSRNDSEAESRQTKSDFNNTGMELKMNDKDDYDNDEREIFEEYLKIADGNQADWDNVLSWMNRDQDADTDLEQDLEELMEQENAEREARAAESSQSPINESVYYSFIGQSEEIHAQVLSPVRSSIQRSISYQMEESYEVGPGLMHVVLNGSLNDLEQYLNSDRTISESEIKEALHWSLNHQNLDVAMLILEDVCKLIRGAEDEMCVDVFPAYLERDRWQPVIVVLTRQNHPGDWDLFMGLPVYRRRYDLVSNEAQIVVNSNYVRANPLPADTRKTVKKALRSARLHKYHSKLTIVNACPCRSRKGGQVLEKGLCIVVHCMVKGFIPFNEEPFPEEIFGIPVDVREGYFLSGVATPPVKSYRNKSSKILEGSCESGSDDDVHNKSVDSNCQSRSESNNVSKTSSLASLKNDPSTKSVMSYKPQVYAETDIPETENNNEEIPSVETDNPQSVDLIDKDRNHTGCERPTLYIGSGITTQYKQDSSPGCINGQGTIGGFIQLDDGGMGFITCAHILGNCAENTDIAFHSDYHSEACTKEDTVSNKSKFHGKVIRSILEPGMDDVDEPSINDITGVDAALIRIDDNAQIYHEFVVKEQGLLQSTESDGLSPPNITEGKLIHVADLEDDQLQNEVIKVGNTTGLTKGLLYSDAFFVQNDIDLTKESGAILSKFHHQLEVIPTDNTCTNKFFDLGDSGCMVYMRNEGSDLQLVGLAIGCTSYNSCIVTPAEVVLNKLRLNHIVTL